MFGRVSRLENELMNKQWQLVGTKTRIHTLEEQVATLTKALEWHVGATLEIMLAEEKLISLRVAEAKERGDTNVGAVAEQVYAGVEQSVNQKLNNDVSSDTDERQERGE